MANDVNPAFFQALRQAAKPTTLEELQARGVQKLRTIGAQDVAFLIERALNRTLVERTLGNVDADEMTDLSSDVEEEFKRQLESLQDLKDSRALLDGHRRDMSEQVADLRDRMEKRESFEEQVRKLGALQDGDALRHLRLQVRGCMKPVLDRASVEAKFVDQSTDDLVDLFQAELARLIAEKSRQYDGEVDQLQRRVAKLVSSLEETEKVLARVSSMKDVDTGIESIYRTVQGLSDDEADSDSKRQLMKAIFIANRKLKEQLSQTA